MIISHFQKIFDENPDLKLYLPDNLKLKRLPKSFIYTLIYHLKPNIYNDLKLLCEKNKANKRQQILNEAFIEVDEDVLKEILNVEPLEVK